MTVLSPAFQSSTSAEKCFAEGNIGFPYDKLAMINKSAEAFDWWRLPAPNDDQVIEFPESRLLVLPVPDRLPD
jgi:hypothetical protein